MSIRLTSFSNRLFPSSSYKRMMFMSVASVAVAVLVVSLVISAVFENQLSLQIDRAANRSLTHLRDVADLLVDDDVQSLIIGQFDDVHRDAAIRAFLTASSKPSTDLILDVQRTLQNIALRTAFVHSIYLYSSASDSLIASREGVLFNASVHEGRGGYETGYRLINAALASGNKGLWSAPQEQETIGSDVSILAFGRALPLFRASPPQGAVVVAIGEQAFLSHLLQMTRFDLGQFFVIDSAGNILSRAHSASTDAKEFHGEVIERFLPEILDAGAGTVATQDLAGEPLQVSWVESGLTGWHYVAVSPWHELRKAITVTRGVALFSAAAIAMVLLVILLRMELNVYRHVKNVVASVRAREPASTSGVAEQSQDELAFMESVVYRLSQRVVYSEGLLQKNRGLIRRAVVDEILRGSEDLSVETANQRLATIGERLSAHQHSVVVCRFRPTTFASSSQIGQETSMIFAKNAIQEAFGTEIFTEVIGISRNTLATYINAGSNVSIPLVFEQICDVVRQNTGIGMSASVSPSTTNLERLRLMLKTTERKIKWSYVVGWGAVLAPNLISSTHKTAPKVTSEDIEELGDALRHHDWSTSRMILESIQVRLYAVRTAMKDIFWAVDRVVTTISREARRQAIDHTIAGEQRALREARGFDTLEDVCDWLAGAIDDFERSSQTSNETHHSELVAQIESYVLSHVDHTLSLTSVADRFGISPAYLSTVYRQSVGSKFSDLVHRARMGKAEKLLLDHPALTVADVGQSVGYSKPAYFSQVFKSETGLTPSQFRQCKLTETRGLVPTNLSNATKL